MTHPTFCLPRDIAESLVYNAGPAEYDGKTYEPVAKQEMDDKRWTREYLQVIKVDGQLFGFLYEESLVDAFAGDVDPFGWEQIVKVYPAYGFEKIVTEYGVRM